MSNQVVVMPGATQTARRPRRQRAPRRSVAAKKKAAPKRKNAGRKSSAPLGMGNAPMECVKVYAKAITNPFDPSIRGKVCAPVFPSRPSQKITGSCFFPSFTTGTNGQGFVMADFTGANDEAPIYVTDSSYATSLFSYSATGVSANAWKTPYGSIVAGTGITALAFRVVSAGFRFRYTGTELNRGGTVLGIVHPSQGELAGQSINDYNVAQVRRYPVTREWQYMTVTAQSVEDLNYVPDRPNANTVLYPWTRSNAGGARPFAALVFNSKALNTFEVELIEHLEFCGGAIMGTLSPSHVGDQTIVNALSNAASEATYAPDSGMSAIRQTITSLNGSGVPPGVMSAITSTYRAMIDPLDSGILSGLRLNY